MKSKLVLVFGVLLIFGIGLIGCDSSGGGGDGGPAVAKADLVGHWIMNANSTLTLNNDNTWSCQWDAIYGSYNETTWSVSGSTLTVAYTDYSATCTVALSADKQALTVSNSMGPGFGPNNGTYNKQ
jgi:hypothetical protein